jgi:hypothetical protein
MTPLPKPFSLIVYFLVFYLATQPFFVWAQSAPVPGAVPDKKVAVFELHDGRVKQEVVEKVADTVRDELSRQGRFEVVSEAETESFFSSHPDILHRIDPANPLNRYLDQAKELYKTFSFKDAIAVLENTISTYRNSESVQDQIFLLTDAYLMLGNVYLGAGNPRKAADVFQEAVRLDPERELTELEYPPKTIRLFQQSRETFLKKAKPIELTVESSPGDAQIYVNGALKGVSPLRIQRFTEGEHFVVVQREGYRLQGGRIYLEGDSAVKKFSLEKNPEDYGVHKGLKVSSLGEIPEQVRLATSVGKLMEVDKVIFVSVEEIGWNYKITARMIDLTYGASHKHKSVEVLDLPKDTRPAAQVLVQDLNEKAHVDLAENPKKYADSEVIVIGKKKRKSFLKSPILWSLLGVVVAGGAASALLLSGGGEDDGATVGVSGSTSRAP